MLSTLHFPSSGHSSGFWQLHWTGFCVGFFFNRRWLCRDIMVLIFSIQEVANFDCVAVKDLMERVGRREMFIN